MNSNYGKSGTSLNNFDFDLGIGSNRSKSLNDQKKNSNSYSYVSSQSKPATTWQPGKPSWTHQPAPSSTGLTRSELGGPTSMVGDIFGKSWNSSAPASATGQSANVGVVNKNPNLFGDLVSSALGQNKTSSNAPLKSASPVKSSFSMGGMADSLPKTNGSNVARNGSAGLGSSQSFGAFGGATNNSTGGFGNNTMHKSSSMGGIATGSGTGSGTSMRGIGGGVGVGMKTNKDPFGSLVDFSSKPMNGGGGGGNGSYSGNPSSKGTTSTSTEDFAFGDFQNASKSNTSTFPSGNSSSWGSDFSSVPTMDSFATAKPAPVQSTGGDPFDVFFTPSTTASSAGAVASDSVEVGGDDWGFDSGFGGDNNGGNTTELEGLPPPPAGVSASSAKTKGLDNYKQGQFADAIKWLSWAVVLLEKAGETASTTEVLTCRASCYKEVGEYKKAVADCTKILDSDEKNVSVLVQRALLYESMEKYRLGAEDLRTVMKFDPGNRVARSTIHRLNKMAD
ncbi:unnamed protein product [Amaranthus hypochondriacus]